MQKINKIKISLIVTNIAMFISVLGTLLYQEHIFKALYWLIIPLAMLLNTYFLKLWSTDGLSTEKHVSKQIQRSFSDITTLPLVIYALCYIAIMFCNEIGYNLNDNIYVIIIFYIITLFIEATLYLGIFSASKETKKFTENFYKENSKKNDRNDIKK